jgi:hypothetical protein
MKRKYWLLLLVFAVLLNGSPVLADGDFYVVAGGGGVGTKITSVPYTISNPGFYYLGKDLTTTNTDDGIIVNADDVTIDLMGFRLSHTGGAWSSVGIKMSGRTNVEIRNGTVRGFGDGIKEESQSASNHRIFNIRAVANINGSGINLNGSNHLVKGCTCTGNNYGIRVESGMIIDSVACNNSLHGIFMSELPGNVIGNTANNNASYGIFVGSSSFATIIVDRNSAGSNSGSNYSAGGPSTRWGVNAGR